MSDRTLRFSNEANAVSPTPSTDAQPFDDPGETAPDLAAANSLHAFLRRHAAILIVLVAFLGTWLIVPTMVNAPVSDDWVYSRSVEILMQHQHLKILDLSVVTLVSQVIWGALFSTIFGTSFGAMRLSTLVIFFLSGVALYGICRELRVDRTRSALGAAAYLFNPLTFGLAFSFMTDPQFLSWLTIATYFYIRGLNPDAPDTRAVILGSAFAATAFLTRQQGILIPFAVGLYLLAARRWRPDREGLKAILTVAGIPALTMVLYYVWILGQGAPEQQSAFLDQMIGAGLRDTRILASRMTYIEMMYIGLFVLPIVLAAVPFMGHYRFPRKPLGIALVLGWTAILVAGLLVFAGKNHYFPYIPQFLGVQGIGPTDLIGGRRPLVDQPYPSQPLNRTLTGIVALSSLGFALHLGRKVGSAFTADRAGASLLACIGIWQVVGILPPSYHFRNWIISVDRYLIPMIPFAIGLLLWSLRGTRIWQPLGWFAIAVFAIFSTASTRDFLVFQQATWEFAQETVDGGVPMTQLDAGSSWDGYHLYEYGESRAIHQQTKGGPWWTNLFAPATNST
ncbi:MAG TPA: glycosyltransferase family 39 protein, partial [Thermomicrobiales bacterium]|nr:glycosyltransferase family 39 protein [Thermomicrobiales bacterium]